MPGPRRRAPLIQSLPGATSETDLYAEDINDELQQVVADFTAIEERCAACWSARLARKQAPGDREPPTRGCGHHLPAHLLPRRFWDRTSTCSPAASKRDGPFLVLGVGLSVACVAVIVFMLGRRGWK